MEEFIRPYIMKKYKEPSKKQNLKQHYSILYANFISRCCFVMKRYNEPFEKKSLKNQLKFCMQTFI